MNKIDQYRRILQGVDEWEPYLLAESNLPGPRANLELAYAAAYEGQPAWFWHYAAYGEDQAPAGSAQEFLPLVAMMGLGRQLTPGDRAGLDALRRASSDSRWRVREAVCMGLQMYGDEYFDDLVEEMRLWSRGSPLEQRAAAAALCEPHLLSSPDRGTQVLHLLDEITASLLGIENRKSEPFRVLQKGLSYCWSVAAAANLAEGKLLIEKWLASKDRIVLRILRENLKKNRLIRLDPGWCANRTAQVEQALKNQELL